MKTAYICSKAKSHILELKYRFVYIFFSFVFTLLAAYWKATQLIYIFLLSFSFPPTEHKERSFIFTDVYEAFSSTISICLISSLLCVLPLVLYHSFCFLLPSWHSYERKKKCRWAVILFICWIIYTHLVHSFLIPKLCSFLLQFQIERNCLNIVVEPKIFSYVSWATNILAIATFVFIFVCILSICVAYGLVDIKSWSKHRKFFVFTSLLLASFISPPELWSQSLLTFLFFCLHESLFFLYFIRQRLFPFRAHALR